MYPSAQDARVAFDIKQEKADYNAWFQARRLCDKCQLIFDNFHDRQQWTSQGPKLYHHSLEYLKRSADSCPICELFVYDLEAILNQNHHNKFQDLDETVPGTITVEKHMVFSYLMVKLTLGTKPNPKDIRDVNLELELSLTKSVYDESTEQVGMICRSTNCEESWTLARRWMEECITSHDACQEALTERSLPTRLVDVGSLDCDTGPRLVLTRSMDLNTRYLTLSHCWGKKDFMTLNKDNIEGFLGPSGIPPEGLSKTFREAFYTTKKLGYRYIWIDSLCIIQDVPSDWNHEAVLMGNVYANSDLNLAASDSPDGSSGLYFDRSQKKIAGWKVRCSVSEDSPETELWDCSPKYWGRELPTNVLSSRAWVFQERYLARRTLSFGSKELNWECRTKQACETFPDSIQHGLPTLTGHANIFLGKASTIPPENSVNNSRGWEMVMLGYSGLRLTYPSDKLVAVSGIARLFAKKFRQKYLAGLWDQDLIRQLNWSSIEPGADLRHLGRAPSWSWTTADNSVCFDGSLWGAELRQCVVLGQISVVPTEDTFMSSKGGTISLRCQSLPRGNVIPHDGIPGLKFGMSIYNTRIRGAGVWPDYLVDDCASQEVFFLPLAMIPPGGKETAAVFGLVLEKISAHRYSRIGAFRVFGKESVEHLNEVLLANKFEQDENFKDGETEETWGGPCFTIKII